jgi:lysyl-tRNA synthetase class 2
VSNIEQNNEVLAVDENHVIAERREKLKALRKVTNGVAFPNDFKPLHKADALQQQYGELDKETLDPQAISATVAGRMMLKRVMGKASFATIQDASGASAGGRIQLYIARDEVGEDVYESFKHWDMGDFLGATGRLFKTRTGELSIHVTELRLLTK